MLGVDSLADLEAVAKRLGGDVTPEDSRTNPCSHFQRPDGYVLAYQSAPRWAHGRPDKWPIIPAQNSLTPGFSMLIALCRATLRQ